MGEMGTITRRVIQQIDGWTHPEDLSNAVGFVSHLIVKTTTPGYVTGNDEIDGENVSAQDLKDLKDSLLRALPRCTDRRFESQILNLLSKFRDRSLVPLFTDYVARSLTALKEDNGALFASLTALEELGELRIRERGGWSIEEIDNNIGAAHGYLRLKGINLPPW